VTSQNYFADSPDSVPARLIGKQVGLRTVGRRLLVSAAGAEYLLATLCR